MKIERYHNYLKNVNNTKESFIKKYLKPVFYKRNLVRDYYIDKDGEVWSGKNNKLVVLKPNHSSDYPKLTLQIRGNKTTVRVHRIVCESLYPIPKHKTISEKAWKRTPKDVKRLLDLLWEVNHIDHNTHNYNPLNLEWVDRVENVQKYQQHRISKLSN